MTATAQAGARAPSPAELAALRARVRQFLAQELAAGNFQVRCDSWLSGWDESFSRRLATRGWVGMTIPEAYGGPGRTTVERYVVIEELLAAGAPVAAHWFADRQVVPSLLRFGTEQQRREFLPRIARAECFVAIGLSEPDSGSDLASVQTSADRVEGGWRLRGTKIWTSGAHKAHIAIVLARTTSRTRVDRPQDGLSQFIVPLADAAVTIRPIRLLTGEHHFNEVILDGVFVPDDRVVGEIGAGWRQVTYELAFERSGPERFLTTYPLFMALVEVLARRAGFVDARLIGSLTARLWTLRQMSFDVAQSLSGGTAQPVSAALVKDLGTQFELELIEAAQLLSGIEPDLSAGEPLPRLLAEAVLHAPGFTLRGGTTEILRGVIARGMDVR
jgi:acyl-CoA dehydrogenase